MPGIPRKPYCQPCKRRRVKCDEKWPTCSACARAGIVCPGPSGMKFVLNNNHKAGREEALVYSSKPNKHTNGSSSASSGNLVLAERPAKTAVQTTGYNSEFRSYRLLNAWDYRVPMTSSDQLSARLVALIEVTPQLVSHEFRCLREIPRRLHLSECLQDSIRYWCSSWIDHHQGLRVPSNMSHNCQGKAIRSLLRAIQGSQVPSIETAAAATALYKTSELFNPNKSSRESRLLGQATGIATLVRLRGIPNMDDPFDVLLVYEQLGIIEPLRAYTGSHEARFCDTPAWQEVRQKVIEKVTLDEGGQEIDLYINNYVTAHGDAAKDIKLCREDPISFCDKAERVEREMRQFLLNLEALFPGHWAYAEKVSGTIIETPDPDFFLGRKYLPKSRKTFEILGEALSAFFPASLMVSRIRRLYDKPVDLDIQKKYRECCERYWMFIPYLRTLDPLTLSDEVVMYMFTIEAANEQETEHIVEFIRHIDVIKEYPSDYDGTLEEIKSIVDLVLGGRSEIETGEPEPATEFFEG